MVGWCDDSEPFTTLVYSRQATVVTSCQTNDEIQVFFIDLFFIFRRVLVEVCFKLISLWTSAPVSSVRERRCGFLRFNTSSTALHSLQVPQTHDSSFKWRAARLSNQARRWWGCSVRPRYRRGSVRRFFWCVCVSIRLLQERASLTERCVCDASAGVCVHETCAEVCVRDASARECVSAMVWDGKEDTAHFWRSPHFQKWGLSRADINCAACFRDISVSRCWRDEPHHFTVRCEQRHTHSDRPTDQHRTVKKKTQQPVNGLIPLQSRRRI